MSARVTALCLLLLAPGLARAGEAPPPAIDPIAPPPATAPATGNGRLWSSLGVAGVYTLATVWVVTHYYMETPADHITIQSDGWFGRDTYAGGADKLGHMWGSYALTRGCAEILVGGGWSETGADITSAALAAGFYGWSEVIDGYYGWGFSYSDIVFNLIGNGMGIVMRRWHALDDAIDLRISYFPSSRFRDRVSEMGFVDAGEDYDGQTFMVAFHLKTLPPVRSEPALRWMKYVDLTVGYRTTGYQPHGDNPRQQIVVGVALNLQHVLRGLGGPGGDLARYAAEVWAPPFTFLDTAALERDGVPRE